MPEVRQFIAVNRQQINFVLHAVVVAAIAYVAAANYFIQDDGFISLRYADHWARGYGPVWYPGSREFGYTNFLFVTLCAGLIAAGIEPVLAGGIVSYSGFALAVIATYAIVLRLTRDPIIGALCVLVIFTNFTVSSYASGLLETSLQAGLILATYWGVILYGQEKKTWQCFVTAVTASLALLRRLDSSLLLLPAGIYALRHLSALRHLLVFSIIPTLTIGGFLIFCVLQYGSILPNTYYAKISGTAWAIGIGYVKLFLDADNFQFAVFITALLAIVATSDHGWRAFDKWPIAGLLFAPAILWTIYIVYVGGDFMGFRLMVPVIIFFFIAYFISIAPCRKPGVLIFLVVYAFITSLTHRWISEAGQASYKSGIESPAELNRYLTRPVNSWPAIGKRLNELFYTGAESDVSIALTAAGSIPFYSRLPAIDMMGLNDRWIALHGDDFSNRAGHRKIAPPGYLESRNVNLIIGHPGYVCGGKVHDPHRITRVPYPHLPVVLVTLNNECSLIAVYNQRHPRIDALLKSRLDLSLISEVSPP